MNRMLYDILIITRFDNTDGHMGLSEISKTPIPKVKGQYTLKKLYRRFVLIL